MKYHDANGQFTKAGRQLWNRAKDVLTPLIQSSKDGWEAKERELIINSALSAARVLKALKIMKPLKPSSKCGCEQGPSFCTRRDCRCKLCS
jgi:hypothetical protein